MGPSTGNRSVLSMQSVKSWVARESHGSIAAAQLNACKSCNYGIMIADAFCAFGPDCPLCCGS